jgi:hypothetical protein
MSPFGIFVAFVEEPMGKNGFSSADEPRLAWAILEYLCRHPEAIDTQDGIATWWLQGHQIEQTVHAMSKALEFLVARAFIVECRGPDSRPYYKLNHQQHEEIARFLGASKP